MKKNKKVLLLVFDMVILGAVFCIKPLISLSKRLIPFCPFRALFGIGCPLCGGTHALEALLQGSLKEALSYNLFIFVLGAYLFLLLCFLHGWVWFSSQKAKKLFFLWGNYKVIVTIGIFAWILTIREPNTIWFSQEKFAQFCVKMLANTSVFPVLFP